VANENESGWNELEKLLLGLVPGDEVQISTLVTQTGLDLTTCEMVLHALTRVELFTLRGDVFVRRRLFDGSADVRSPQPPGPGCSIRTAESSRTR
jgi:hypothetical protein